MADSYEVSADLVRQHATNIARITSQLDAVIDAARRQGIPAEAFGLICEKLNIGGWLVTPLHDRGVRAVDLAIAKADEIRATLTKVGGAYDQTDGSHADQFAQDKWLP